MCQAVSYWRRNYYRKMTITKREIIEKIFNEYKNLTIKELIAEGIKAGRKQLAEEIIPMINKNNVGEVTRAIVLDEIKEKLQKEAEKWQNAMQMNVCVTNVQINVGIIYIL